jgi:hypothetical protein
MTEDPFQNGLKPPQHLFACPSAPLESRQPNELPESGQPRCPFRRLTDWRSPAAAHDHASGRLVQRLLCRARLPMFPLHIGSPTAAVGSAQVFSVR